MNNQNQPSSGSSGGSGQGSPVFAQPTSYGSRELPSSAGISQGQRGSGENFPLIETPSDLSRIQRIYQPLDGAELARAVGAHVEKLLLQSGLILGHLVYEQPIWRGTIAVSWTACANNEVLIKVDGEGPDTKGAHKDATPEALAALPTATVELVHLEKDTAPDDIRESTNQPTPVLQQKSANSPGGVVRLKPGVLRK